MGTLRKSRHSHFLLAYNTRILKNKFYQVANKKIKYNQILIYFIGYYIGPLIIITFSSSKKCEYWAKVGSDGFHQNFQNKDIKTIFLFQNSVLKNQTTLGHSWIHSRKWPPIIAKKSQIQYFITQFFKNNFNYI